MTDPASSPRARLWTEAGLFALAFVWGVNFSVIKTALSELDPLAFNALRFPLACAVLLAGLGLRRSVRLPERTDVPRIVLLAALGHVLYQLFFIFGIDGTRAGNASLLLATVPVWTTVFSTLRKHEHPEPIVWGGVIGTFLGVGLVVLGGGRSVMLEGETVIGDLLTLGAAILWSAYTVESRNLVVKYGSLPMTAWTLWVGTLGIVAVGTPELLRTELHQVTPQAWAGVAYAGALGIALAYLLWYRGVRRLGNTRTAVYSNLVPVVALLVAWLWLGEVPTPLQLGGAALILSGLSLTRMGRSRKS